MPSDSKKKRYNLRNKDKKDKEKERKNHSDNGDKSPDDDDDEEDIGKDATPQQNALDYDSDEKDETGDGAQQELISLDGGSAADKRKKVPKLKKPGK